MFLASPLVGEDGKIIGVDFTPEMIEKAKANAEKGNYRNVDFILANIDNIPLPGEYVDFIISNCVINLASDKQKVFNESYRLLKNGGIISISDTMLSNDLPEKIFKSISKHINCFTGAVRKDSYIGLLTNAGFKNIKITKETHYPLELMLTDPKAQAIISEIEPSNEEIIQTINSIMSVSFYAEK